MLPNQQETENPFLFLFNEQKSFMDISQTKTSKEPIKMHSSSLLIKEVFNTIRITVRYTATRMAKIKTTSTIIIVKCNNLPVLCVDQDMK